MTSAPWGSMTSAPCAAHERIQPAVECVDDAGAVVPWREARHPERVGSVAIPVFPGRMMGVNQLGLDA
jgi:hypothetical protein